VRKLFLDDERMPGDVTWIALHDGPYDVVRTQDEFVEYLLEHGIPDIISFDNDLGIGCGEGRRCVKWMVEQVLDGVLELPEGFRFTVHSKNVPAAEWITKYLNQFLEKRE
jgi:hypothetical protein